MIPKNEPPKLEDNFSPSFQQFVSKCLEMKQSLRWDASQLLKHEFITSSKLERKFDTVAGQKTAPKTSLDTIKASLRNNVKGGEGEEWDFSVSSNSPVLKKVSKTKSLGKSVAFEDEFDSSLPEQQYHDSAPFGRELLKSIVIPAFSSQLNAVSAEGRTCIERVSFHLGNLAQSDPEAAENACRCLLENMLNSSRQSLREFVASVTVKKDMEYFNDFEETDQHKLNFYIAHEQQEAPIMKHTPQQSRIAERLLLRWIKR